MHLTARPQLNPDHRQELRWPMCESIPDSFVADEPGPVTYAVAFWHARQVVRRASQPRMWTARVMMSDPMSTYHAHVYFDATTLEKAHQICTRCRDEFGIVMGRMHSRPVGPHPDWSCQLKFEHHHFADVVRWLALNRDGLAVLVHPETGEALRDHRDHAIWMGAVRPLDLSMFNKNDGKN